MRFLIAGSSGFLGTRLREQLESRGHEVTSLVRRPPNAGEVTWEPYSRALDPSVVDRHDVVVNLAGSPMLGNPYSKKWSQALLESRVRTTRALADAIAASENKPAFLAGNGISYYGDHGSEPLTEAADSRGAALLTRVAQAWQAATEPAAEAGVRVCVLRTAPLFDRRMMPLQLLRVLFKAGLGGPLGSGQQYVPMISARDWVDAAVHLAENDGLEGPFNLCCAKTPTNAEFTRELARQVRRPAVLRVPAFALRTVARDLGDLVLDSVNGVPAALLADGFRFQDPDVSAVLCEGLDPSH